MKMSWGTRSVKVSFPYGDLHDEPEGIAPRRVGSSRPGGKDHEPERRRSVTTHPAAISATQAAGPRGGPAGAAASKSRPSLPPAPAGRRRRASPGSAARLLRGLQRHPPDREAARDPHPQRDAIELAEFKCAISTR